ncbi:GNAT family N-acetyltransferase [Flavobacterium sp. GT3R68]|uniref:GNAT family N-acetyltransferase n=1 Tax=Flavobacterium sp. GT3R68 TaxID=2594437 RepID=UPI000F8621D0|nr:GNAT family N-acetyltransferase [Flavobacterium sp. GT3R68]RTY92354.1 GNAT family N-acetyltransferase [Flavobacterium sp. GSN2]TRW92268.1 GNAT family N-acetyltransferase [Flavobacterium sp. GT3R68]
MKKYTINRYNTNDYSNWNAFVSNAKNATFLFNRDFMEYHKDRFEDYSLVVTEGEKWIAVFPANCSGNEIFSHQGLTYGGLIYHEKAKLTIVISVFRAILSFLHENKKTKIHIKTMPSIYHDKPAEELEYALFLAEAKLIRRDSLSVLDLRNKLAFSKTRKESIRHGIKNSLIVKEEADLKPFWKEILIPNLANKHQVNPVHTISEIENLRKTFPENIRHFNVYHNDKIVAGTTVFVSKNVAHPQYISGQGNKNELGSLDFLYNHLITDVFKDKRFFDFGISNEELGRKLNEGLVFWKESYGASTIVHDFYEVETANFSKLDTVII